MTDIKTYTRVDLPPNERWHDADEFPTRWNARTEIVASMIPAGVSVLDVGAGKMALRDLLKEGCDYTGLDVVARDENTIVLDLDQPIPDDFDVGTFDFIVFGGVFEYLTHDNIKDKLKFFLSKCDNAIVTYHVLERANGKDKFNSLRSVDILNELALADHYVTTCCPFKRQMIYKTERVSI